MDILHAKNAQGFCIVSSDSDYTGLAKRIREEGMFVMGIGEKSTPIAFVNSCELFIFTENLRNKLAEHSLIESSSDESLETLPKEHHPINTNETDISSRLEELIDRAFEISAEDEDETYVAHLGLSLRKIDPSFDPRTYGYRNLSELLKSFDKYEIIRNMVNGLNHPLIKLKV